jgi:hypothetical protein
LSKLSIIDFFGNVDVKGGLVFSIWRFEIQVMARKRVRRIGNGSLQSSKA